jgi:hypothetical protein
VYVNLVEPSPSIPHPQLSVPLQVPLYNRIQIFTLIDNFGVSTSRPNEVACVSQTVPYLFGNSGSYLATSVGYGYTNDAAKTTIWQPLSWDVQQVQKTTLPAVGTANTNNNIILALANLINSTDLGWAQSTYRVIYVMMKESPVLRTNELNALNAVITNTGIHVVFCLNGASRKATFDAGIAPFNIPRVASVAVVFPSFPTTETTSTIATKWALPWVSNAYSGQRSIIGRITIVEASADKSPSFSDPPAQTIIRNFGSTENPPNDPDFQYYTTLPATISLPAGYPVAATAASMPYTVTYKFVETGHTFDAIISWNEPPSLKAPVLTASFSDSSPAPYIINVIDSIRSKLDPNINRLDIMYTSSKFTSSIPPTGWVASAIINQGTDDGKVMELNTWYNSLGLRITAIPYASGQWELEYMITDRCRQVGPGKIIITYTTTFVLPTCTDRSATINFGDAWAVDLRGSVTETPLGYCSPATLTSTTCAISGCSSCIAGTGCCTLGTALGTCQSTASCPGGASFVCDGASCPVAVTCVLPGGSTCNSATCFGSVSCSNGCPVGYQTGMLCYVDRTRNTQKVCCAQYAPHNLRFSILTDLRPSYGVSYSTGVTTWSPLTTYGSPNAQFGNLKITPGAGISGNAEWDYRVTSPNGASVQCALQLTVKPRPSPPTITVTPTYVETVPTTFGTWLVTISDVDLDVVSLYITDKSGITFTYIEASSFGVADLATYPSATPISPTASLLLGGLDLSRTTVPGTVSFLMRWKPLITHPYNLQHTVKLFAKDPALSSGVVSVKLGIPKNDPPIWLGTMDTTTWPQYSSRFPVQTDGRDPNLADTEKLSITITDLPSRGKLSILVNGVYEDVVKFKLYPYTVATGVRSGRTTMPLYYTPDSSFGSFSFSGYFADPSGLQGPGTVTIVLTPVPKPPETFDASVSTKPNTPTPINVPATDVDGDLEYLIVTRTNFAAGTNTILTWMGDPVIVGQPLVIDPVASSFTFVFNYETPADDIDDSFFYIAYDSRDAPSSEHKATIVIPKSEIRPTARGDSFSVLEKESLDINFVYGDTTVDGFHYQDEDGEASTTKIQLKSNPTAGQLYDASGVLLGEGSTLPSPYVKWVPIPGEDISGPVTFDFVSVDADFLVSDPATMTINIIPVDDPPTISMIPDGILVDRLSTDTFKVTVKDPDSQTIDVKITNINLPFGVGSSEYSTFEVRQADGTWVTTYNLNLQPSDNEVLIQLSYPDTASIGGDLDFYIVWGPTVIAPDNTKGSFSLLALSGPADATLQSNKVTGTVEVTPNRIPYPVDNAEGTRYTYSVTEDGWPADGHTFDLVGSDADPWHRNSLTIQLQSLPTGVVLTRPGSSVPLTPEDLPLIVTPTTPVETTTLGQLRGLPVVGWSGEADFSFVLIDGLGAVSVEQVVKISVAYVPHPPTSADETLIVWQDSCIWFYCGAPDDLSSVMHAHISGQDPDEDQAQTLTLLWETLPDATRGEMAYYPPGDDIPSRLLAATDMPKPDHDWNFWFQPVKGARSAGCDLVTYEGCQPFTTATFRVQDAEGLISERVYTLTIYVLPVNAPPVGQNLKFTIKEDEQLVVYWDPPGGQRVYTLPVSDPDNTFEELTTESRGISTGSQGTWLVKIDGQGQNLPERGDFIIPGKYLVFRPPPDQSSMSVPMSTLYYRVQDLQPLFSDDYMIQVYVEPVPDVPKWLTPLEIRTQEDTQVLIQLNNKDVHWTSVDTGDARIVITKIGKGHYSECDIDGCTPFAPIDLPFTLKDGTLYFQGLQDEFGENYSEFVFRLEIVDENGNTNEIAQLTNIFTIHVDPVNDPPVLIPRWYPRTQSGPQNECDEDTFLRVNFTGTDIDSPLEILTADILLLVDPLESLLYTCTAGNHKKDCADGPEITTLQKIERKGIAEWEVSFVPAADWNGGLKVQFVIYDEFLPSQIEDLLVIVRPINDPPSIVKGATSVRSEFYDKKWVVASSSQVLETDFTITINTELAKEEKLLPGTLLEEKHGSPPPTGEIKDKVNSGELVVVRRLRTKLQDKDFFFQYHLTLEGSLIRASWVPEVLAPQAPCKIASKIGIVCKAEIRKLNNFLSSDGLPILIEEGAHSALALFLLNDTGNVDKWDRPLQSGFTIEFFIPDDSEVVIPIAAIVILPVIAAVSAVSIAAAWFLLGSRAQAYAGASFDAFAITSTGTGTKSPLYEEEGRNVNSPLYAESAAPPAGQPQ